MNSSVDQLLAIKHSKIEFNSKKYNKKTETKTNPLKCMAKVLDSQESEHQHWNQSIYS